MFHQMPEIAEVVLPEVGRNIQYSYILINMDFGSFCKSQSMFSQFVQSILQ
jgi:hypothetical protein